MASRSSTAARGMPSLDFSADHLLKIIAGLSDGIILIGADRKIIWANEAGLAMHGVRRIEDLGRDMEDYAERFELRYRNNHPLDPARYPLERLAAGERFDPLTVEMRRQEDPERRWIHLVHGVILDGSAGEPATHALILCDETERVEAEERFESAFNANPAPALICRLSDLAYIRVNPGFLEMTGYEAEEVLGRGFDELDILAEAERGDLARDRLRDGRVIPQMESAIPLANGGFKFVILAGEPINVHDEDCILFTFADLDPRKRAENALRQSEELFAKSFHLSPAPAAICRLEGFEFVEINNSFHMITGFDAEELTGRSPAELKLWADKAELRRFQQDVGKAGIVRGRDMKLQDKDGITVDCLVSAARVRIDDEPHVLWVMQDITDRKRSEGELMAAIEAVMADTSWFSRSVVEKLAALRQAAEPRPSGAELKDLTNRERDVLGLICRGLSNAEMSRELGLSTNTIRNHVFALYQKIGVNRRAAAIIWGRERGITGPSSQKPRR